jgi:hypothetical protein
MEKERKIKPIVRKVTFAEAEIADDEYWTNATEEERLQELIELRRTVFAGADEKMKEVVTKRNRYEEALKENKNK